MIQAGTLLVVLEFISDQIKDIIKKRIDVGNLCKQNVEGGLFVSTISEGKVISSFYHPTKRHSATADGGILGGGIVRSIAGPGETAIAYSSGGIWGRKTYYNVLND